MTQGEGAGPGDVDYLGVYVVDVPPAPSGPAKVTVTYAYDTSGTVQVQARAQGHATPLAVRVEPLPDDVPDRFLKPVERREPQPVTVYLCFDLSGSMHGDGIREAKRAAHGFLSNMDLSHARVGVMGVPTNSTFRNTITHLRVSFTHC